MGVAAGRGWSLVCRLRVSGAVPGAAGRTADAGGRTTSARRPGRAGGGVRPRRVAPRLIATAGCSGRRWWAGDPRVRAHPGRPGSATVAEALPEAAAALRAGRWCWSTRRGASGWTRGCGRSGARPAWPGWRRSPGRRWFRWRSGARTRCCRTRRRRGGGFAAAGVVRRPVVRVRFGAPVDLSGLPARPGRRRCGRRPIVEGIADAGPLRADEAQSRGSWTAPGRWTCPGCGRASDRLVLSASAGLCRVAVPVVWSSPGVPLTHSNGEARGAAWTDDDRDGSYAEVPLFPAA